MTENFHNVSEVRPSLEFSSAGGGGCWAQATDQVEAGVHALHACVCTVSLGFSRPLRENATKARVVAARAPPRCVLCRAVSAGVLSFAAVARPLSSAQRFRFWIDYQAFSSPESAALPEAALVGLGGVKTGEHCVGVLRRCVWVCGWVG
jgi:hypothetical protein